MVTGLGVVQPHCLVVSLLTWNVCVPHGSTEASHSVPRLHTRGQSIKLFYISVLSVNIRLSLDDLSPSLVSSIKGPISGSLSARLVQS